MPDRRMIKAVNDLKKKEAKLNKPLKCEMRGSAANPFIFEKKIETWLEEENLILLEGWARGGLTDIELAKNMGINPSTLYVWCNKEPRIKSAITRGRTTEIFLVENALAKAALGYEYQEEQVTKDGDIVVVTRYQPPSQDAIKFFLTNRARDRWKARQDIDMNTNQQIEIRTKADNLAEDIFGDKNESDN